MLVEEMTALALLSPRLAKSHCASHAHSMEILLNPQKFFFFFVIRKTIYVRKLAANKVKQIF